MREQSNTQLDFFAFVEEMVTLGFLVWGDVLVVDNATVHVSKRYWRQIEDYLLGCGVMIVTLPTYSPELNPCELVFARVKGYMRSECASFYDPTIGRSMSPPFKEMLGAALSAISFEELDAYYRHCRNPTSV